MGLDELKAVQDTLTKMRNHSCTAYHGTQKTMQELFRLITEYIQVNMDLIQCNRTGSSLIEEIVAETLARGRKVISGVEIELLNAEKRLGQLDSIINFIDAARTECVHRCNDFQDVVDGAKTQTTSGMFPPAQSSHVFGLLTT